MKDDDGKVLMMNDKDWVNILGVYRYSFVSGAPAVRFWLQLLIGVPDWVHNSSVLYLLDTICQQAFVQPICWQEVLRAFSEVMKVRNGFGSAFMLLIFSLLTCFVWNSSFPCHYSYI